MQKRSAIVVTALFAAGMCIWLSACAHNERSGLAAANPADEPAEASSCLPAEYQPIEVQANTFTASTQANAALDIDADGNVVVVWDSRRQQRGSYGVYVRRFDLLGRPLSEEIPANTYTASMQGSPAVAAGDDGSVWIVWNSFGQDGAGWGIVARRFEQTLASASPEIGVNTTRDGDQSAPAVAVNAAGDALVVWTSQVGPGRTRVFGRLLDCSGQPKGAEFRVGSTDDDHRDGLATVTFLPDPSGVAAGRFLVAWARTNAGGNSLGIFAQQFDSDGSVLGSELVLNDQDARQHIEPAVAADARGRFAVAWMSSDEAGYSVRARWFDEQARPLGPSLPVAGPAPGYKSGASLAMSPDGRALICYNSFSGDELRDDVYAAIYDGSGTRLGSPFRVNRHAQEQQALSVASGARHVAWGARGELAFAWSGDAQLGDRSAANLTFLVPAHLERELANRATPQLVTNTAPLIAEPHLPPVWDPNWKPLPPLIGVRGDGPDFGFEAVPYTGWTPPDPETAVGQNHIVVIVNGEIAFFTKDGTNIFRDEIEDSFGFWGDQGADYFVFDPEVHYDPHADRFWAMACERSDNNRSMFLLAVSDDGNPDGTWYKWRFDVTPLSDNDIDSPNLAFDHQAVYLTADFFGPDKYLVYMLDKAALLSGETPATTSLLITGQQSFGIPVTYDADAPAQYMLESTEYDTNTIVRFHAIRDPLGSPYRVTYDLSVEPYRYPGQPPQKGTSTRPYLFEPRFWSCLYRNGSLWAVHHIRRVDESDTIARWYEFAMNGWPESADSPTIVQWGEIDAGPGMHEFFPSIFADDQGNAAITFARSSTSEYIGMWRVIRRHEDPLGEFREQVLVKGSSSPYYYSRWGDFSGTQTDPVDPCVFWGHHEWTDSTSSWRTWVARYENYNDADLNRDGTVNQADLGILLADWGCTSDCVGDIDGDDDTDQSDLGILLANWGDTCE